MRIGRTVVSHDTFKTVRNIRFLQILHVIIRQFYVEGIDAVSLILLSNHVFIKEDRRTSFLKEGIEAN